MEAKYPSEDPTIGIVLSTAEIDLILRALPKATKHPGVDPHEAELYKRLWLKCKNYRQYTVIFSDMMYP